jgi:hypothetical protein
MTIYDGRGLGSGALGESEERKIAIAAGGEALGVLGIAEGAPGEGRGHGRRVSVVEQIARQVRDRPRCGRRCEQDGRQGGQPAQSPLAVPGASGIPGRRTDFVSGSPPAHSNQPLTSTAT